MTSGIEDLWTKIVRNPDGTTRTVPSARHGRGLRWRARYIDDAGARRSKAFARKADAQGWLDEIITALTTGSYVAPEAGKVTVATVYAGWSQAQAHISPKTAATRRSAWTSRVKPVWGEVAVADVRTSAVKAWIAKLVAGGLGTAGIENAFGLLRQILSTAVEDSRIPRNPCEGVKLR